MKVLQMLPLIIIPAFQPNHQLQELIKSIVNTQPNISILVVNDGSTSDLSRTVFENIRSFSQVILLNNARNIGKGATLKVAFNYYLQNYEKYLGVVTADADGQHHPDDIIKIAIELSENYTDESFILGCREFTKDVPLRSKFGNILTSKLFKILYRTQISDTQTGLRGFGLKTVKEFIEISGNAYEWELNCLITAIRKKIVIKQINIRTIYEDNNSSSHFNPIIDSAKIYFVFIRFSMASLLSVFIDYLVFFIFYKLTEDILNSFIVARLFSGIFNFILGKRFVFKSFDSPYLEFLKYAALCIALMYISSHVVTFLHDSFSIDVLIGKIISESALFIISYTAQQYLVFSSNRMVS